MKKVIQSKAFRESDAKPAAVTAHGDDFAAEARSDVDPRSQVAFRRWLEGEADAAAIIHAMSYCVSQSSELAARARNYAARLRLYVARLSALLPLPMRVPYGAFSVQNRTRRAMTPAACERAAFVLVEYLLHHVERTRGISCDFGNPLKTGVGERLLRRMDDERELLAKWIRTSGYPRTARPPPSGRGDGEEPWRERPGTEAENGQSFNSYTLEHYDPSSGERAPVQKIFYNPPQVVRWM